MIQHHRKILSSIAAYLIGAAAILAPSLVTAEIYKTRDAQGNVVFTDVPPKDQSETVKLSESSNYTPPVAQDSASTQSAPPQDEEDDEEAEPTTYSTVSISSPAPEEAVRENSGNVTVTVRSAPRLATGHTYTLLLDGQPVGDSSDGVFTLENVDRGTHTLSARITDKNMTIVAQGPDQTFHMLRFSALSVKRRKAG